MRSMQFRDRLRWYSGPMSPIRLIVILLFARVSLLAQSLPGTQPLTLDGDLAARMLEGMDRFLAPRFALDPRVLLR